MHKDRAHRAFDRIARLEHELSISGGQKLLDGMLDIRARTAPRAVRPAATQGPAHESSGRRFGLTFLHDVVMMAVRRLIVNAKFWPVSCRGAGG